MKHLKKLSSCQISREQPGNIPFLVLWSHHGEEEEPGSHYVEEPSMMGPKPTVERFRPETMVKRTIAEQHRRTKWAQEADADMIRIRLDALRRELGSIMKSSDEHPEGDRVARFIAYLNGQEGRESATSPFEEDDMGALPFSLVVPFYQHFLQQLVREKKDNTQAIGMLREDAKLRTGIALAVEPKAKDPVLSRCAIIPGVLRQEKLDPRCIRARDMVISVAGGQQVLLKPKVDRTGKTEGGKQKESWQWMVPMIKEKNGKWHYLAAGDKRRAQKLIPVQAILAHTEANQSRDPLQLSTKDVQGLDFDVSRLPKEIADEVRHEEHRVAQVTRDNEFGPDTLDSMPGHVRGTVDLELPDRGGVSLGQTPPGKRPKPEEPKNEYVRPLQPEDFETVATGQTAIIRNESEYAEAWKKFESIERALVKARAEKKKLEGKWTYGLKGKKEQKQQDIEDTQTQIEALEQSHQEASIQLNAFFSQTGTVPVHSKEAPTGRFVKLEGADDEKLYLTHRLGVMLHQYGLEPNQITIQHLVQAVKDGWVTQNQAEKIHSYGLLPKTPVVAPAGAPGRFKDTLSPSGKV